MNRAFAVGGRVAYWLGWPLWHWLLRNTERTRVLVIADDSVLLVKSYLGDGGWGLPGGGLHKGEDPASGAVREVVEETGVVLDPKRLQVLGRSSVHKHGHTFWANYLVCRTQQNEPFHLQWYEIAQATWMPLSEAAQLPPSCGVSEALQLWEAQQKLL